MSHAFFIIGTNTGVGKTFVTVQLLKTFNAMGYSTLGLKPIASGAEILKGQLRNDDALQLQQASSVKLPYEQINPFCFEPPISPNIAAEQAHQPLSVSQLASKITPCLDKADICLIETAGGLMVPLNDLETQADLIKAMGLPVILVVGMTLGCLNHTLLTIAALKQHKIPLLGWVANGLDSEMLLQNENIHSLVKPLGNPVCAIKHQK